MMPERRTADGLNWGLIVGGAMAFISVAFGRRNKRRNSTCMKSLSLSSSENAAVEVESTLRRESSSASNSETSDGDDALCREAIHKLRHQLKSRDEMIMEMQVQLTDKERALYSHKSLVANLERQLKEAHHSIFEVERVIQELREEGTPFGTPVGRLEAPREASDGSMVLHAKEGEYDLVFEKAKHLEAELVGIRAMAQEMASLLEMSERERLRLHHVVSHLQQKLAFQAKELSTLRATTHFLKTRRSADDLDKLSGDEQESPVSLKRPISERYAAVSESVEGTDMDPTSSSAGSYPELTDTDWSSAPGRVTDYILGAQDSPGIVRIGSPTMVRSPSSYNFGVSDRYPFEAVEVEEQLSSSSSLTEDILDDTLEDLLKATTPDGSINISS